MDSKAESVGIFCMPAFDKFLHTILMTKIYYVVSQTDVSYVASQKAEGGQLAKCVIRLREFGGSRFGNEYVGTMFGNLALCRFYEGDLVAASLQFQVHEVNGDVYQEVVVNDVVKLQNR